MSHSYYNTDEGLLEAGREMSPVVDWGYVFIRSRGQPKWAMGLRG